jgi:hypothetical protein
MARTWGSIGALAALLAVLTGCEPNLRQKLRPPKQDEAYNLPAANDPRWDKPLEYPKGTLNQEAARAAREAKEAQQAPPGSMGGGGPSGRMGMGGGGGGY